jgi:peroxiredoxin-like protein
MDTTHHYEVKINWEAGRKGLISSPDLKNNIEVATPPEFPKGIPGIWSPEHLFVAAVNSCLMTTFLAIAENSRLEFLNFESNADGKLEKVDGKYVISEIILSPQITLLKEEDKERAIRILEKSEAACLISNSVKSKIILNPKLKLFESPGFHNQKNVL